MDRFEKTLMKKSIAENMMSSTHVNGGFSAGPHIGTIRHVPSKNFFRSLSMHLQGITCVMFLSVEKYDQIGVYGLSSKILIYILNFDTINI